MNEKRDCKIVQDLLPNYVEKLTDEETNKFIEEHLDNCKGDCKSVLDSMQKDLNWDKPKRDEKIIKFFKKYNKRIKFFQAVLGIIAIIVVFLCARRMVIISSLQDKANAYAEAYPYNYSYKMKIYGDSFENIQDYLLEIYSNDYRQISKLTIKMGDGTLFSDIQLVSGFNTKYYSDINNEKIFSQTDKVEPIEYKPLEGYFHNISVSEFVRMSLFSSIKSAKVNNKDCYVLDYKRR